MEQERRKGSGRLNYNEFQLFASGMKVEDLLVRPDFKGSPPGSAAHTPSHTTFKGSPER